MNNLIEIKLEVTALQLTAIGRALSGETSAPVTETPTPVTETPTPVQAAVSEAAAVTSQIPKSNEASTLFSDTPPSEAFSDPKSQAEGQAVPSAAGQAASAPTVDKAKGLNGQLIPWDARIHGSAKKTNADGSWRLKQGVDRDVLVAQVEAELMAAMGNAPTASVTAQPVSTASPDASIAGGVVVPPPPATKPTTFAELLPLVTAAKAAGTLTDAKITEASSQLGLAQFGLIATRPDLIPQMVELLGV